MLSPTSKIFLKISHLLLSSLIAFWNEPEFKRMLITIGEAVKNLSPQLRREYPYIPWRETTGTRDKIVSHYFGVDYDSVFETIKIDLPELKQQIEAILATPIRTPKADEKKRKNQKTSEKRG